MLQIIVPATESELFDENTYEFITIKTKEQVLQLEHSLISLSKWESKWCKPILTKEQKTKEETLDYIRCMTLNSVNSDVYKHLTKENLEDIEKYINAPMTATTVNDGESGSKVGGEQVTSELVYYWMVALNIPFECQKWHLNRLIMLIRVCNAKNKPPKKMSKREIMSRNAALNAKRRQKHNTRG